MGDIESSNNKRIAKNTLLLYFRMFITMALSLYTSRLVLKVLGVEDFGIYNVVGGVVAMFNVLSYSFSSSISRFITYALGKGDEKNLSDVFSSAMSIQIGMSLLVVLLAETIGVWFLNTKMSIPPARLYAANWVLQFSIATFVVNLISVPYNAAIIAHEQMKAFAYVSVFEVVIKLIVVYVLFICPIDTLIVYASLLFIVSLLIRMMYAVYCKRHFIECNYTFVYRKSLIIQMSTFAGWNVYGATSAVLRDQGVNVAINLFCGPAVNAARGIATQINNAISAFMQNFMTALNPQIIKSYSIGDMSYMMTLVMNGARLSFYLLLVLSIPIIIEAEYVLKLWLEIVPEYAVPFAQLILIYTMVESLSIPLKTTMYATGNIKKYQIVVGTCQLITFPISYIVLYFGFPPQWTFVIAIVVSLLCLIARLIMLKGMVGLSISNFMRSVVFNVFKVSIVSVIVPVYCYIVLEPSIMRFFIVSSVSVVCSLVTMYTIGCSKEERSFVRRKIVQFFDRDKYIK